MSLTPDDLQLLRQAAAGDGLTPPPASDHAARAAIYRLFKRRMVQLVHQSPSERSIVACVYRATAAGIAALDAAQDGIDVTTTPSEEAAP